MYVNVVNNNVQRLQDYNKPPQLPNSTLYSWSGVKAHHEILTA